MSSLKEILKRLQKLKELTTLGRLVTQTKETEYKGHIDSANNFYYNKWTLLKLLFIQLYVPLYTSIISKYYKEFNYIDPFAGSGVNILKEEGKEGVIIAGSPIIALSFAPKPFTKAYLNDIVPSKITLLRKRIELLKCISQNEVHRDYIFSKVSTEIDYDHIDANKHINRVYDEIEERSKELLSKYKKGIHNLAFIDPFGLEFKRSSLERILNSKVRTDIITLFNSYGAGMQAYNVIHLGYSSRSLDEHLGGEWYDYIRKRTQKEGLKLENISRNKLSEFLSDYYVGIFLKHNYVVRVIRLPLKLEAQQFDLIFACRRTKRGNPFLNGVEYIKEMLENTDYKLIDELLNYVITGRMPGLIGYIIKNPEEALEKYKTARRYGIKKDRG